MVANVGELHSGEAVRQFEQHSGDPTVATDGEQGGGQEQNGGGAMSGEGKRKATLARVLFL
jgi:hypothetical protein